MPALSLPKGPLGTSEMDQVSEFKNRGPFIEAFRMSGIGITSLLSISSLRNQNRNTIHYRIASGTPETNQFSFGNTERREADRTNQIFGPRPQIRRLVSLNHFHPLTR